MTFLTSDRVPLAMQSNTAVSLSFSTTHFLFPIWNRYFYVFGLTKIYIQNPRFFLGEAKNNTKCLYFSYGFQALPTVKSIQRLKSHGYNQYSLLYPFVFGGILIVSWQFYVGGIDREYFNRAIICIRHLQILLQIYAWKKKKSQKKIRFRRLKEKDKYLCLTDWLTLIQNKRWRKLKKTSFELNNVKLIFKPNSYQSEK